MNIRKQFTRIAAVSAVLASFFAGARAAHAGETLVTTVPFAFTMGDKTFPAGEYQFQVDQFSRNVVLVRSTDSSTSAIALSRRVEGSGHGGAAFVRFNIYGGEKFLSTIQTSRGTAVALARGSKERDLAKLQGATSVATLVH